MAQKINTQAAVVVTTAGTQVTVSATDLAVTSVYIEAAAANTGIIYVGDSNVSSSRFVGALAAGQGFSLSSDQIARQDDELILSDIWIDSSVNGESAHVSFIKRR